MQNSAFLTCFLKLVLCKKCKTLVVPGFLGYADISTPLQMANTQRGYRPKKDQINFRYLRSTDTDALNRWGYYHGFPCPHHHTIRDSVNHWCYECVLKIKSNLCGFDLNYLDMNYKTAMHELWNRVEVGGWEDCWDIDGPGDKAPARVWMPSYRSHYTPRIGDNITVQKAVYTCAWGDPGRLTVSRTCNNVRCCNPLHLVTSWNRKTPPKSITPFCVGYEVEKLMLLANREIQGLGPKKIIEQSFKKTILSPKEVRIDPKYNED